MLLDERVADAEIIRIMVSEGYAQRTARRYLQDARDQQASEPQATRAHRDTWVRRCFLNAEELRQLMLVASKGAFKSAHLAREYYAAVGRYSQESARWYDMCARALHFYTIPAEHDLRNDDARDLVCRAVVHNAQAFTVRELDKMLVAFKKAREEPPSTSASTTEVTVAGVGAVVLPAGMVIGLLASV